MTFIYQFIILFIFFSSSNQAEEIANRVITLIQGTEKINIGKEIYYFEDKKDENTFEQIIQSNFQKHFIRSNTEALNFSITSSSYWVKFDIRNLDNKTTDWFLEIANPQLDLIEFYSFDNGKWNKKEYGDTFPFKTRELFSRTFVIPVNLIYEKQVTFYLKFKSSGTLYLPLIVYKPNAYYESSLKLEILYSGFYGILAVMILYNGFISLAFRSLTYLLYCLSTFSILSFYIGFNGHGFQYFWQNQIWWQNNWAAVLTSLVWISTFSFTNRFLELKNKFRFLYYASIFLQLLFLGNIAIMLYSYSIALKFQNVLGIPSSILVFSAGVKSLVSGNKSARFFVFAWFTYLFGVIVFILSIFNLVERNFLTVHIIQIGSMIELILLSLALADKYKFIQDENVQVHKKLFDSQRIINETLEEKVVERTVELNVSLKLIKEDLFMAKKIQSATLASNFNQNEKLEILVKYNALNEVGGDFYSVEKLNDSTARIFLADATGHGVQAALIMMAIQGIYDTIKNYELPVNDILEIFNKEFIRRYKTLNSFLTCILLDIDTANSRITYSSAGHPAGLIINQKKEFQLLSSNGGLIGVDLNKKFMLGEKKFTNQEKLFIFTDGIFEEFVNEEEFGEDRLYQILLANSNGNIITSINEAMKELNIFLGNTEIQDDITIIGITYKD